MFQMNFIMVKLSGGDDIMLLEYEVSNFTVFRDKTTLSMKPGKVYHRFSDNVYKAHSKMKVSKFALIVGENGSGDNAIMMIVQ